MEIGKTVTWREAITEYKHDRRIVIGERIVTGVITDHVMNRRGGKILKIMVTDAQGAGPRIIGRTISRKSTKIKKGRSWYKAGTKSSRPNKPKH